MLGYWSAALDKGLTWIFNVLNDVNLTDSSGLAKAVRADVLRQIPLKHERLVWRELSARLAQWNLRLFEVPVSYGRTTESEHGRMSLTNALAALCCLVKWRFVDTRFTTHDGYYILQSIRYARWIQSLDAPSV